MASMLTARQLSGSVASTSGRCHRTHLLVVHVCCQRPALSAHLHTGQQQLQQQQPYVLYAAATGRAEPAGQRNALPPAEFTKVKSSVFVGSSVNLQQCPPQRYAEFAVIGRSNVGKSSLINMLTQNSKLAKVSKQPGMTKTINHFLINDSWYLVDLPGYGYAKTVGRGMRDSWLGFTKDYFVKREALAVVMLLVDASIPPQQIDLDCANWLAEAQVPFCVVFTKCDARKKGGPSPAANMKAFKQGLLQDYEELPACFETSAAQGTGRSEVLQYLASVRQLDQQADRGFL